MFHEELQNISHALRTSSLGFLSPRLALRHLCMSSGQLIYESASVDYLLSRFIMWLLYFTHRFTCYNLLFTLMGDGIRVSHQFL